MFSNEHANSFPSKEVKCDNFHTNNLIKTMNQKIGGQTQKLIFSISLNTLYRATNDSKS